MFQSFSKLFFFVVFVYVAETYATDDDGTYCDGTGWIAFRDEKCYKLIKKWANRNDAKDICNEELLKTDSSSPQLVAIKSAVEQDFLTDYIFNASEVKINVWTGAKRLANSNQFVWDDGSNMDDYTNWTEGSPDEGDTSSCVVMQSREMRNKLRRINGKWRDVSCESPNYVVCEKLPRWSIGKLQQTLLEQRKQQLSTEIELTATKTDLAAAKNDLTATKSDLTATKSDLTATKSELFVTKIEFTENLANLKQSTIPIGFIFNQLPNRKAPSDIWPWMVLTDVSSAYAGVFFRVEGGGAEPFGQVQEENSPRLTHVANTDQCVNPTYIETVLNGWSDFIRTGSFGTGYICTRFAMHGGEVRPRNMAIRIWERIG